MADENQKDFMLTDDMELDEIDDLPSFEIWPTGLYKVCLQDGVLEETINEHPTFKIPLYLLEVMHCEEGEDVQPKIGSQLDILCMRDNKFGAATYKLFGGAIRKANPECKKVSELNERSKGFEAIVLIKKVRAKKKDKNDTEERYFARVGEVLPA